MSAHVGTVSNRSAVNLIYSQSNFTLVNVVIKLVSVVNGLHICFCEEGRFLLSNIYTVCNKDLELYETLDETVLIEGIYSMSKLVNMVGDTGVKEDKFIFSR